MSAVSAGHETHEATPSAVATRLGSRRSGVRALLADLARSPFYVTTFVCVASGVTLLYTLLLPYEYTQRFSFLNWHFLTARLLMWSVVLGLAMGVVVAVQVAAIRRIAAVRGGALTGFALIGAVLPSLLCCSPMIPTLLAFIGVSGVGLYSTSGTLQHFFAVHQTQFLAGSLALLVLSGWWGLSRAARSVCLSEEGCAVEDSATEDNCCTTTSPSSVGTVGEVQAAK